MKQVKHAHLSGTLSLFSSASTLICCAMPALFVTLGAGATLAGLTSNVPQLIWLSRHKIELFAFATFMLSVAGYLQYRARHAPCPADAALARACTRQRRTSLYIYLFSLGMYALGATFAFILPWLGS